MTRATFHSHSPAETAALGRRLGRALERGQFLAMVGPLGAGKTHFVQGLGRGLGVRRTINSPSFVIMKRYDGRLPLAHWDWYRLDSDVDLESTGFGDLPAANDVVVVEWADRFLDRFPESYLLIEMAHEGPAARRIDMRVRGDSPELTRILHHLQQWWAKRHE